MAEVRPVPYIIDPVSRIRTAAESRRSHKVTIDDTAITRRDARPVGSRRALVRLDGGIAGRRNAGTILSLRRIAVRHLKVKRRRAVSPGDGGGVVLEQLRVQLLVDVVLFDVRQQESQQSRI